MGVFNLSAATANAALMSVVNLIDGGGAAASLRIYSGAIPADVETAATGTLLAELALSYPCIAGLTVTTASWATNEITYQITGHGLTVGARVKASGFSPSGYDGEYTVTTVVDANNIKVAETSDPGTFTSAGTFVAVDGSSLDLAAITEDSSANATGTAGYARVVDSNTVAVMDVDVGTGTESLVFNTTAIELGKTVTISSFTLSV